MPRHIWTNIAATNARSRIKAKGAAHVSRNFPIKTASFVLQNSFQACTICLSHRMPKIDHRLPPKDLLTQPVPLTEENLADFVDVHRLHGRLRDAYLAIPEYLKTCSEIELDDAANPTPVDYALRKRFTEQMLIAKEQGLDKIPTVAIYGDLINQSAFLKIIQLPHKMAWMSRQVVTHEVYYASIHALCLKKLWAMVAKTEVDPKYMAQILKLTESAANRSIGPVVQLQRVQVHSKQEIQHSGDPRDVSTPDDPEQLKAKIKEMQAKLSQVRPIEIEGKSSDD